MARQQTTHSPCRLSHIPTQTVSNTARWRTVTTLLSSCPAATATRMLLGPVNLTQTVAPTSGLPNRTKQLSAMDLEG